MVDAKELHVIQEDGSFKSAGVWYCGKCRHVGPGFDWANNTCCVPDDVRYPKLPCERCGFEQKHRHEYKFCDLCWTEVQIERGKLQVIGMDDPCLKELDLPFFDVRSHRYFDELESFFDYWENHEHDCAHPHSGGNRQGKPPIEPYKPRRPKYLFVTVACEFKLDAYSIVECELENSYEDAFSSVGSDDLKELQSLLDTWVEKQCIRWNETGSGKVVLIDWSEYEKRLSDEFFQDIETKDDTSHESWAPPSQAVESTAIGTVTGVAERSHLPIYDEDDDSIYEDSDE